MVAFPLLTETPLAAQQPLVVLAQSEAEVHGYPEETAELAAHE